MLQLIWDLMIKRVMRVGRACSRRLYAFVPALYTVTLGLMISVTSLTSYANPQGGSVAAGQATVQQTSGTTTINQSSQKAIINWQSFNINKGETTHFNQPAGGVALNRISPTAGASQIYGTLTATGQIILVNPAGIYFGPGAYVNVGGLIASTANITDQNFLNGIYQFSKVNGYSGAIINEGQIIAAQHGLIALVAPGVINNGLIEATMGRVILGSGEAFTINFSGNDLISFAIDAKTTTPGVDKNGNALNVGVKNAGTITANGGKIIITAKTAAGVLDQAINMQGVAQAKSFSQREGQIILSGDADAGNIIVAAKLDASGKNAGEKGGKVEITGKNILIESPTVIDVSGDVGGGDINIGGNYRGEGPLTNAALLIMMPEAKLYADALTSGNGGNVILWSDEATYFYGDIYTRGGAVSGNGGFIETSSKDYLEAMGMVYATASNGLGGTWLLDPRNLDITAGAFNAITTSGTNPITYASNADNPKNQNSVVTASTINTQLNAGVSVIVDSSAGTGTGSNNAGNITVSAAILKSSGVTTPTLTLNASGTISIGSTIGFTSGGLNLSLISGGAVTQSAALTLSSLSVNSGASAITLTNASNNVSGAVSLSNTGANNVAFTNSVATVLGASSVGSGTLGITSGGSITQTGAITQAASAGAVSFTAGANVINLSNASNNFTGSVTLSNSGANAITLTDVNALTMAASSVGSGTLTLNSGGLLTLGGNLTSSNGAINMNSSGLTLNSSVAVNSGTANIIANAGSGTITLNAGSSITANNAGNNIILAGGVFTNNAGGSALSTGSGSYLVWSGDPSADTRGGLTYNFKQYNATYGVTSVLGTGNGFLYTLAPTVTASLTGTVSKTYDGSTTATLAGANYSSSGAVDGDTVTLNNPTSGSYDNRNVGTSKNVSVSGIAVSGATNGAATVYGYQMASSSANANIGTITPASLTISSNSGQTKVYGNNDPGSASTAYSVTSGTLYGPDALTGDMGRVVGETVGNYNFTQNTVAVNDGNSGNNYTVTFNGATNPFVITARALTASIAGQSKIYGANDPTISGIGVTLGNVVNASVTDINGNSTPINDTANVAVTLASLSRTAGETVSGGPYSITGSSFNALTGSAAGNYSAPSSLTGSPTLTINQASLSGSIANQNKVYGADDPSIGGISVSLSGVINNPIVATWNGNTSIIDIGNVIGSLSGLSRTAGETVSASPYAITGATFSLSGSAAPNYSSSGSISGSPTLTITQAPLTATIANQNKVYGADDPSLGGMGVTLGGLINRTVATWNGNVAIDDSALTSSVSSLTRAAGENVGVRNITAGTFSSASANYSAPSFTGSPTLTIDQASLTASIANQNKVYGEDDPSLGGIGVTLGGLINRTAVTWNGNVAIDDSALSSSVSSLTRAAGENVGVHNITAGTFSSASANYSAPSLSGTPTLTISQASLTGSIANQNKVYGEDDPSLAGIGVTLGGLINRTAVTWNGNVAIDDSALTSSVSSLTRAAGENVGVRNMTAGTFSSASANYSAPSLSGTPTLTISQASLTGSIANQNKVYGEDDPSLAGIGVTLGGLINRTAVTWNGNVAIDDSALSSSVSSLTRQVGENVGSYDITGSSLGAVSGNYTTPTLTGTPSLTIDQASLTGAIADQNKVYGADDPSIAGIGVTLSGVINNSTVVTWNGNTSIDDTGNVSGTLSGLVRDAGESVSLSPYAITAGSFNLSGSAASNYSSSGSLTGSPTLTITPANLTGSIANQNKVYGANDPSLGGMSVTLSGLINRTVASWNGNVNVNDSALTGSLSSLTRVAGENVGVRNITGGVINTVNSNYNTPTFTGTPTLTISQASLTASIANQNKVYGEDDPSLGGIGVTLGGLINRTAVTWNGNVAIDDSALSSSVSSLTRAAGENVGVRNITAGTFSSASANYSAPSFTGSPTLTIGQASLTASIANQNKVYGEDDPSLAGIGVTLGGLINRTAVTWNGNVAIDDSALSSSVNSLTRAAGENVGVRNITAGTFSSASANYSAPSLSGTPTLTISQASLTGSIANQNKVYGEDDPSLAGIGVTLGGLINRTAVTWNGNVAIDDSALTSSVSSLTRAAGESVGVHNITAGTFSAASANYSAPVFTGTPSLTIDQASLTGSIANQNKVYGANDPAIAGIGMTLSGVINTNVTNWMGGVTNINDTGNVSATLSGLTRNAGENVGSYAIIAGNFNLSGSASSNYATSGNLSGSPVLIIGKANLTASFADQSKVYGTSDPLASTISVALGNVINNPVVTTWNGNVSINDTSKLAVSMASYTRAAGETVLGGPYAFNTVVYNALTGVSAGNYNVPVGFTGAPVLTITPATLIAGLTGTVSKIYDSSLTASLNSGNYSLTGVVGSDSVNLNNPGIGSYATKDVGTGKSVNVAGLSISGSDASNYQLLSTSANAAIGNITPAQATVSGVTANNKVYDGNTSATLNTNAAIINGIYAGDNPVALDATSYVANFVTAYVGNGIVVVVNNLGLSGVEAHNYTLIQPIGLTADIRGTGPTPTPTPPLPPAPVVPEQDVTGGTIFPTNYQASLASTQAGVASLGDLEYRHRHQHHALKSAPVVGTCLVVSPLVSVCVTQ